MFQNKWYLILTFRLKVIKKTNIIKNGKNEDFRA